MYNMRTLLRQARSAEARLAAGIASGARLRRWRSPS
jgi:hypothetical protein